MKQRIDCAARRMKSLLKGAGSRALSALKGIRDRREGKGKLAYYAALALLLALLGTASYAYRGRRQTVDAPPTEPPRAALSVQTPTFVPDLSPTPEPVVWVWPLEGEIVGGYSPDAPVWTESLGQWQTHPALDIAGSPGEAVYACRDGTVLDAWSDRLWGNRIVIGHEDGYRSDYAGLNTLRMVQPGDAVKAGQVIGSMGESAACEAELGWHVHFELTKDGAPADFEALVGEQPTGE